MIDSVIKGMLQHELVGEQWLLHPDKFLFHSGSRTLVVGDLHFGKAGHFRKAGIAVPGGSLAADLEKLETAFELLSVEKVIFLGDLFHSSYNNECKEVAIFLQKWIEIEFVLVQGNHDIIPIDELLEMGINAIYPFLDLFGIRLQHEPPESGNPDLYYLCAHIHPGIKVALSSAGSVTLPCFYFGKNYALVPAFGSFTGSVSRKPLAGDTYYGIVEGQVIKC